MLPNNEFPYRGRTFHGVPESYGPLNRYVQVNYGNFMHGLMKENIQLNRKVLSELSMHEPLSFKALVDISRDAFPGNKNVVHPPRKVSVPVSV